MNAKDSNKKIRLELDNRNFNKKMKSIDDDLKDKEDLINSLMKSIKGKFDNKKFLEAQKLASQALVETNKKAENLKSQLDKMDGSSKKNKNAKKYKEMQKDLTEAQLSSKSFRKTLAELETFKAERLFKSFNKTGDSLEKAGKKFCLFLMPLKM